MFKGLGLSMFIISFLLVGVPYIGMYAMLGSEGYARQCKMSIAVPCFGVK